MKKFFQYFNYPVYISNKNDKKIISYLQNHFLLIKTYSKIKNNIKTLLYFFKFNKFKKIKNNYSEYIDNNNCIIISSKRFIRVIDFDKNRVVNYLKNETSKLYLDNEIESRLLYTSIAPKLISYNENQYIDELYIEMLPVKSINLKSKEVNALSNLMMKEYFSMLKNKSKIVSNYIEKLFIKISELSYENKEVTDYLLKIKKDLEISDILVSLSHCDLRMDQILVSRDFKKIKILDWECSTETSYTFDVFFFYFTRKEIYTNVNLSKLFKQTSNKDVDLYFNIFKIEMIFISLIYTKVFNFKNVLKEISHFERIYNSAF